MHPPIRSDGMENKIDLLKQEHVAILDALKEARRIGLGTESGRQKLTEAKELFRAHLHHEEEQIYAELRSNPATRDIAKRFHGDMQMLAPTLADFFKTHIEDGTGETGSSDLGQLLGLLQARFSKEEYLLYPTAVRGQTAA